MKLVILLSIVASTLTFNFDLRQKTKNVVKADSGHLKISEEQNTKNQSFFFIGDSKGSISQYDKKTSKLVKTYNSETTGVSTIESMTRSGDKLIFSGNAGNEKYTLNFLENEEVKFSDSYAGDNELPMLVNNNSSLIFTGCDFGGNDARVKKWDLKSGKMIKEVPWGFNYDIGMTGLTISKDDKWIFVGGEYGELMQMNSDTMEFVHNYTKDSIVDEDANVLSMFVTPDSKNLFFSNELGYVKQFNIETRKLVKDWGIVTYGTINKMLMSDKGDWFLTSDSVNPYAEKKIFGSLKMFSVANQNLIRDFGVVVEAGIQDMIFANHEKTEVLLLGADKKLYTFSIKEGKIVNHWGLVSQNQVQCIV